MMAPMSRTRWTHPSRTAGWPTAAGRSAPQVWVRRRSPRGCIASGSLIEQAADLGRRLRPGYGDLGAVLQVLQRDGAGSGLVVADERGDADADALGVLELLARLVDLWIEPDARPGSADFARAPQLTGERQ